MAKARWRPGDFITKALWQMTPKQYRAHRIVTIRRNVASQKSSCTRAEAEACIGPTEYFAVLILAARQGCRIPNIVLDRVGWDITQRLIREALSNGYPDLFTGYMPPHVRAMNATPGCDRPEYLQR